MDKLIQKNSFCKWIEPVSFDYLPMHLQKKIVQANAYTKKFDFYSFLKLMLLAVSNQKNQLYVALIAQQLTYLIKLRIKSILSSLTVTRYLLASLREEETD